MLRADAVEPAPLCRQAVSFRDRRYPKGPAKAATDASGGLGKTVFLAQGVGHRLAPRPLGLAVLFSGGEQALQGARKRLSRGWLADVHTNALHQIGGSDFTVLTPDLTKTAVGHRPAGHPRPARKGAGDRSSVMDTGSGRGGLPLDGEALGVGGEA